LYAYSIVNGVVTSPEGFEILSLKNRREQTVLCAWLEEEWWKCWHSASRKGEDRQRQNDAKVERVIFGFAVAIMW